jgi:3-oxoacyl-[acyl-carrier protein] reductase
MWKLFWNRCKSDTMFDLTGKTALVTGASGGIGGAIATALHGQGATVALSGTRQVALDDLAAALGERSHTLACDLSDETQAEGLSARAENAMGSLDIIVNNAGITRDGLMMRMSGEDWRAVLDLNLTAAFLVSKPALRGMAKRRFGRIINIASVVGAMGNAGQTNYAAAKAGLVGMTKSLARELASRGVTANCIAPGFIETPMTKELAQSQRDAMMAGIPAAKFGMSNDVAGSSVFLASDEAAYITGQTLHVNGGLVMV